MRKKLLYFAAPLTAFALLGAGVASAHGFGFWGSSNLTPQQIAQNQTDRFTREANLLGISVDDVKNAWAKGETLQQLAQDHGITQDQLRQKLQDQQKTELQAHLQTLVDQGVITQDQMNQRLQFMENNQGRGFGFGRHMRGMGMMF